RRKAAGRHRAVVADRGWARALRTENAVSGWHDARDLRARGLYCQARRAGAQAPRELNSLSRRVRSASPDRSRIVPGTRAAAAKKARACGEPSASDRQRAMTWAQLLKRVFAIDIEICRSCGGKLRGIASNEDSAAVERTLWHRGRDATA